MGWVERGGRFRRWEEKGNKESMNRWTWTWLRRERNTFGRYFARSVTTRPKGDSYLALDKLLSLHGPTFHPRNVWQFLPPPRVPLLARPSSTTLIILICPTIVHFYYSHILRTFSSFYFPPFRIYPSSSFIRSCYPAPTSRDVSMRNLERTVNEDWKKRMFSCTSFEFFPCCNNFKYKAKNNF